MTPNAKESRHRTQRVLSSRLRWRLFALLAGSALLACSTGGGADIGGAGSSGASARGGTGGASGGTAAMGGNSGTSGGATGGSSSGGAATGGAGGSGGMASGSGGGGTNGAGASSLSGGTGGTSLGGSAGLGGSGASGDAAAAGSSGVAGAPPGEACDAVTTVAKMKLGWNLGNSLDSVDTTKSDTSVETAWGNPSITPALMTAVASAGFGAIRVPVSWIGRFGPAPDYALSAPFINRVEEVVKYALAQNLYVIINLHHDGGEGVTGQWLTLVDGSKQVTDANTQAVLAQFRKIWAQIADHFASYGDHLIFEAMNEIKVGYDAPLPAYLDEVNGLNQAFVDTVRASGGYNPKRCLVVPGYNTNIDYTVSGFAKPTDTSAGKLILSDHYYDPWSFAGEASTHVWGTGNPGSDSWGQEEGLAAQIAKLESSFIDHGLPVIWGEYGAVTQKGYESYHRYYMEYVTKAVHDAGIVPFFWDNGSLGSGSEAFGLINRADNTVLYPDVLAAMLRAVTSNYTLADVAKPQP